MNGRLVEVAVEDGETVEAGQRLAVVEAMKMEHASSPRTRASCATLRRALGDQVEMGERIMRVEADEKAGAERHAEGG